MNKIAVGLTALMMGLGVSAAMAAGSDTECGRLDAIRMSDGPTGGSLAAVEHVVTVTSAAIAMIDLPCGKPYIISTDAQEIAQTRAQLYRSWKVARESCLQMTSGAGDYSELPDESPCKAEISAP